MARVKKTELEKKMNKARDESESLNIALQYLIRTELPVKPEVRRNSPDRTVKFSTDRFHFELTHGFVEWRRRNFDDDGAPITLGIANGATSNGGRTHTTYEICPTNDMTDPRLNFDKIIAKIKAMIEHLNKIEGVIKGVTDA